MTDRQTISTTPGAPAVRDADRRLQRGALPALVALVTESAGTEATLDREHAEALADLEGSQEAARDALEQKYQNLRTTAAERHQKKSALLTAGHETQANDAITADRR